SIIISISFYFIYTYRYPNIAVHPVWVGFLFTPFVFAVFFLLNFITAFGKYLTSVVFYRLLFPSLILILVILLPYLGEIKSVSFIIISGICWIILMLLLFWSAKQNFHIDIKNSAPEYEISHWFYSAMPFWVRSYFVYSMNNIGIIILGILKSSG